MTEVKTGFILINKPSGLSSHSVVNHLRRLSGIKRIGHAGTLDPLASGLMILAIGREYTKQLNSFIKLDKEYRADIFLGGISPSYDGEQKIVSSYSGPKLKKKQIKEAITKYSGTISQRPPIFSAKKIRGQRAYRLARQEKSFETNLQTINISGFKIINYRWPHLKVKISCSSGTYIRSLAHDLGQTLGTGAYLYNLERTAINGFYLKKAVRLKKLNLKNINKHIKPLL